jgi:periplasmic protein TonB
LLRVYVLPSGQPEVVELKHSSGSSRLDESALSAVRQWRFVPARRGSEAVAAWVVVPVSFSLAA